MALCLVAPRGWGLTALVALAPLARPELALALPPEASLPSLAQASTSVTTNNDPTRVTMPHRRACTAVTSTCAMEPKVAFTAGSR